MTKSGSKYTKTLNDPTIHTNFGDETEIERVSISAKSKHWLENFSADKPVTLAFLVFATTSLVVIVITTLLFGYSNEFFQDILVETHGMLLDLLVIGVLVFWLNRLGEQRRTIKKYEEELEDFRFWQEPQAAYRLAGVVKRMNKEGVHTINLSNAYLHKAPLRGVNLREAHLYRVKAAEANFRQADLHRADFRSADLKGANLTEADLSQANLMDADLTGADLRGANLSEALLNGANLKGANFLDANLKKTDISSAWFTDSTRWPSGYKPEPAGALRLAE